MHVFGVENRDTLTHKATGVIFLLFHMFRKLLSFFQLYLTWTPCIWAVFCETFEEAWSVQSCLCMLASLLGWWSRQCKRWREVRLTFMFVVSCQHVTGYAPHLVFALNLDEIEKPWVLLIYLFPLLLTRVLLCLKRALRIANAAQQMSNAARGTAGSVTLFVEILNK